MPSRILCGFVAVCLVHTARSVTWNPKSNANFQSTRGALRGDASNSAELLSKISTILDKETDILLRTQGGSMRNAGGDIARFAGGSNGESNEGDNPQVDNDNTNSRLEGNPQDSNTASTTKPAFCLRDDVKDNDRRQLQVLNNYKHDLPTHWQLNAAKYTYNARELDLEFLNPTTCPYFMGYQHGNVHPFGLPSMTQKGSDGQREDTASSERIVIELVSRRNQLPKQFVYLSQCSEYLAYDKTSRDGKAMWSDANTPGDPRYMKKEDRPKLLQKLNMWSKPCDASTQVSFVFVRPAFLSWSKAEGDKNFGYGPYLIERLEAGDEPYQAVGKVNSDVIAPRVSSDSNTGYPNAGDKEASVNQEDDGVELLCRQPIVTGQQLQDMKESCQGNSPSCDASMYGLYLNIAVKLGCINSNDRSQWQDPFTVSNEGVSAAVQCLGSGEGAVTPPGL